MLLLSSVTRFYTNKICPSSKLNKLKHEIYICMTKRKRNSNEH